MNETEALTILAGKPHIGPRKFRQLIERFGSAMEALEADLSALSQLQGFGPKVIDSWSLWKKEDAWKKNLEKAYSAGVSIVPFNDPRYPKRLKELQDAPPLLYIKGELKDEKCIAIVGTRQATIYGKEMAESFAKSLAAEGWTIVSGLARGIDTAAHKAALETGSTAAVLGSGIGCLYPRENGRLADEITKNGAVISEFPMMAPPDKGNFPKRNRIVSGMSEAVILIEAPVRSGAMITMDLARFHGRACFVLPGRADCENYAGNFRLLREGKGKIACSAEEVLEHFGHKRMKTNKNASSAPLSDEEKKLIDQLPAEELTIDRIAFLTKLPMTKLHILLTSLLLKRAIKKFPGNYYRKIG